MTDQISRIYIYIYTLTSVNSCKWSFTYFRNVWTKWTDNFKEQFLTIIWIHELSAVNVCTVFMHACPSPACTSPSLTQICSCFQFNNLFMLPTGDIRRWSLAKARQQPTEIFHMFMVTCFLFPRCFKKFIPSQCSDLSITAWHDIVRYGSRSRMSTGPPKRRSRTIPLLGILDLG